MSNFLLEIGTEELPASYLAPALAALGDGIRNLLKKNRIGAISPPVTAGTPRRLVLHISDLPERVAEETIEVTGPGERIAYDGEGQLTRVGEGFLKSHNAAPEDVSIVETKKGRYIRVKKVLPALETARILSAGLREVVAGLPFPKSMYWTATKERFARPVRRILCLFGAEVVGFEFAGVRSGRKSVGHPFLAPEEFEVAEADYERFEKALEERQVIVDPQKRIGSIRSQIAGILKKRGAREEFSERLVGEVANLVEYPDAVEGQIRDDFLRLPKEVVIEAMATHQRYFPLVAADGGLMPGFIAISNRAGASRDLIADGNRRVLSARLSDACFFYDQDKKTGLAGFAPRLGTMLFHQKLGTYLEKTAVLEKLAARVAGLLCPEVAADAVRAAGLCKADLLSSMVYEFPSLEGVMGCEYALAGGEKKDVALAIREHYLPSGPQSALPSCATGAVLAITDKVDTVAAMFAIGEIPSSTSDPFALRRQTIGIVRILLNRGWRVNIRELFAAGLATRGFSDEKLAEIVDYCRERLRQQLTAEGARADFVGAVMSLRPDDPVDAARRLLALTEIDGQGGLRELANAFERVARITRDKKIPATPEPDEALFEDPAEKKLYRVYVATREKFAALAGSGDYVQAAGLYAGSFSAPLHEFFDQVLVMCDDEAKKNNRLTMLLAIYRLFKTNFADLEKISYK